MKHRGIAMVNRTPNFVNGEGFSGSIPGSGGLAAGGLVNSFVSFVSFVLVILVSSLLLISVLAVENSGDLQTVPLFSVTYPSLQ